MTTSSHDSLPVPHIQTTLPGPNAKQLIALDEQFTSPSYTRDYPLAVASGNGAVITDVDGNRFLDFTSGIAVCATGHCHPKVVEAIQSQSQNLVHMSGTDFFYEPQARLAETLANLAPGNQRKQVFFTNSGAEAVEAAFKLARFNTNRHQILAFSGAFHGRTMGALSLTGSKTVQKRGFGPLVPGVTHVEYPDPYRRPEHLTPEEHATRCIANIEEQVFHRTVPPEDVAAIIVEPIQGEGGYIVPPSNFHRELKALAEKHRILYIADEIQAGMGRTGKMFAIEHWGVEPDIICTAKGIASGMPLGAIIARAEVMNWPPGSHASTFGGNPISCAAALATIELLETELIANAAAMETVLIPQLQAMAKTRELIGDIRGKGLMLGVELVKTRTTKERASTERNAVVQACFRRGLLVLGCGENSIRLAPPLMITQAHATTAVRILGEAIDEVTAG